MKYAIGIYAIVHVATGRHYVGSSRNVQARFKAHRSMLRLGRHHSPHLQRAWSLYGEDAFAFCLLEAVGHVDDLLQIEQVWIDRLRAGDPTRGFNTALVAGTRAGVKNSEESRRAMSVARKGKPKSAEHRAKIGAANQGKVRTEEVKARIAAKVRDQANTPERIAKSVAGGKLNGGWNKGLPATDETRMKMSDAAKRRVADAIRDGKGRFH